VDAGVLALIVVMPMDEANLSCSSISSAWSLFTGIWWAWKLGDEPRHGGAEDQNGDEGVAICLAEAAQSSCVLAYPPAW